CRQLHIVRDLFPDQRLNRTDDLRRIQMRLAVATEAGEAGIRQAWLAPGDGFGQRGRGLESAQLDVCEVLEAYPARPHGGAGEAARDDVLVELERLEKRRADVR